MRSHGSTEWNEGYPWFLAGEFYRGAVGLRRQMAIGGMSR